MTLLLAVILHMSSFLTSDQKRKGMTAMAMTVALHVKKTRALFMLYASESVEENTQGNKGMNTNSE